MCYDRDWIPPFAEVSGYVQHSSDVTKFEYHLYELVGDFMAIAGEQFQSSNSKTKNNSEGETQRVRWVEMTSSRFDPDFPPLKDCKNWLVHFHMPPAGRLILAPYFFCPRCGYHMHIWPWCWRCGIIFEF